MACYHPLTAWRTKSGTVQLAKELPDAEALRLPCGGCLGCRMARAKEWALRCHLELQQHQHAVFTTLTYDETHLPPTLDKIHLQRWLKRLRKTSARPLRFFASGEYGEQNSRPHYHAILYGMDETQKDIIHDRWGMGYTKTVNVTPQAIAYVAGYAAKKIGWRKQQTEQVDPETGELYTWQPPFAQMSRRPGIGGHARTHSNSWREYAVHNGHEMPVPRYLHDAWEKTATELEKEDLAYEKMKKALSRDTQDLKAKEQIAIAKQQLQANKRKL